MVDYYKESIKVETEFVKMGVTLLTVVGAGLTTQFLKSSLSNEEAILSMIGVVFMIIIGYFTAISLATIKELKEDLRNELKIQEELKANSK